MKNKRIEERIQHSLNAELSGWRTTSYQRDKFYENATGGCKVKKKISTVAILVAALMLFTVTAFAVGFLSGWGHIEQAMDIAVEYDEYDKWSLDAKIRLITSMREDGIEISEDDWLALQGDTLTEQEKHSLANNILTSYYGDQEYIWFYTIATVDWGEPQTWSLEQRYWFFNTMREKGLYGDYSWLDLLPEKGDLTQAQAESIAKQAVAEAFELPEDEMVNLHGDVSFFITDEYEIPRWQICLYRDDNVWATEYTVLLTREGEVTEDPEGLGILTPVHERQRREEREESTVNTQTVWEITALARINANDPVYYNPSGEMYYHFLQDCPLVHTDYLPLTALDPDSEEFQRLTPCPACVQRNEIWSMQDKIRYGIGYWMTPQPNWIGEEKALGIAHTTLNDRGIDVSGLYPVIYWSGIKDDSAVYYVSFVSVETDNLGYVRLNFRYTVEIEPVNGLIVSIGESDIDGNG